MSWTYARATTWRRSSGTVRWLPVHSGWSSLSCVYWFTRYSSAVRWITSAICWPSLLTYPEDPQSGHQAAATSLCHVQVASSGTELSLFLLPEPGTDYQWNLDTYVQAQTENILLTAELQNWTANWTDYVMRSRSTVGRSRRRTRNRLLFVLYCVMVNINYTRAFRERKTPRRQLS